MRGNAPIWVVKCVIFLGVLALDVTGHLFPHAAPFLVAGMGMLGVTAAVNAFHAGRSAALEGELARALGDALGSALDRVLAAPTVPAPPPEPLPEVTAPPPKAEQTGLYDFYDARRTDVEYKL